MSHKLTQEEFIDKANKANNFKYTYEKTVYDGNKKKVIVTCPKHGDFEVQALSHMQGHGCAKCRSEKIGSIKRKTKDELIQESIENFGDKYDFSLVQSFKDNKEKIKIICPIHGEFEKSINGFLRSKYGCPKCGLSVLGDSQRLTTEEFINRAKLVHNDYYDYSKTNYRSIHSKVTITCPKHGDFQCIPKNHLNGAICFECKLDKYYRKTTDEFIFEAKKKYGDYFNYDKTKYFDMNTLVTIICPIHGEIEVTPQYHLRSNIGCKLCSEEHSRMEIEIKRLLQKELKGHLFIEQYKADWLGKQSLDFYIPSLKLGIECQGLQHYLSNHQFGGKKLEEQKERDEKKLHKCKENNVEILYFCDESSLQIPQNVYRTHEWLINELKRRINE